MTQLSTTPPARHEGKAKIVTAMPGGEVNVYFKDDATAFNAQKHALFAGKGALNAAISARLFAHLRSIGIANHFIRQADERTLICRQVEIIALEVVVRFAAQGSLVKRTGLPPLHPCDPPVIEFYYKRDDLGDPIVNFDHIRLLELASAEEVAHLSAQALKCAKALHTLFGRAGIRLLDLKFEFGRHGDELLLADEISPDTCRLHEADSGRGLDKDLFRFDQGDLLTGYREVLRRLETTQPQPKETSHD